MIATALTLMNMRAPVCSCTRGTHIFWRRSKVTGMLLQPPEWESTEGKSATRSL